MKNENMPFLISRGKFLAIRQAYIDATEEAPTRIGDHIHCDACGREILDPQIILAEAGTAIICDACPEYDWLEAIFRKDQPSE